MKISNKLANFLAAGLLLIMGLLTFGAMTGDSLTMDEKSHLPAGYSYITQKDMRINPEHPPLVKDLAGLGQIFISGINFPYESKAWTTDVNGQWDFGQALLFDSDNPADEMIFWGRLPMIGLLLILGIFVFKWARELFGNTAGLLALFLFAFSPTFLAHGHLVTTDVAAALGVVMATYYFVRALKNPRWQNLFFAGITLGIAELLKFSAILLFPLFVLLALIWWAAKITNFKTVFKTIFVTFAVCFIVIWPVYQFHTFNYPPQRQVSDSKYILSSYGIKPLADLVVWAADKPILRPYAQYFLGVLMVTQRVTGGNTTYFLGEVSAAGWKNYFPIVYLLKETLVLHIMTLAAIIFMLTRVKGQYFSNFAYRLREFIKKYLAQTAMVLFLAIYWSTSISGNLNIGVRHLIPVLPFTMILAAGGSIAIVGTNKLKAGIVGALCVWQAFSIASVYPSFLSYFNEAAGGPSNGYKYVVDSNLDWGQDLKRLKTWADNNGANKIYIDYFGGADPKYYFGDRFQSWWSSRDKSEMPSGSYLAVSATFLQGQRGWVKPGSDLKPYEYMWLNDYQPAARIGNSIFVYYIK